MNLDQELNDLPADFFPSSEVDPFSLSAVTSSKRWQAQKFIVYGTPGCGKTSFSATFPSPILLRFEDGANALDIPTFPKVLTTLSDFNRCLDALLNGNHSFQTVIIDSLDWMEPVTWNFLLAREGKHSIEDWGFGKGYIMLDTIWRNIIAKVDRLKEKGMNIIAICHAQCVTFDPPDSDPYMTYSLKLHKRASAMWTEWADNILFLDFQKKVSIGSEGKPGKAQGTGNRVIYTSSRPAYVAKTRWALPQEVFIGQDTKYIAFHKALAEASDGLYTNDLLNPEQPSNSN